MKSTFILCGMILSGLSAKSQTKNADVKAIEKQVDAMVNSWNKHDYSDMKTYCTTDCSWVNIVGMWWKGLKEVEYSHQFYHSIMFKNTTMTNNGVDVRIVGPTTAVVHFKSHVTEFTTPDGHKMPAGDDIALLIYLKKNGKWLMTAGENININPEAQKNDPVLHMHK